MRVLMLYGNPYHDDYGGVNIHSKHLVEFLKNDETIELIELTFEDSYMDNKRRNSRIICLKRLKFAKFIFPIQLIIDKKRIKKTIEKINPDIVHIQSTIPLFSSVGVAMAKRIPTVITVHGYLEKEYKFQTGFNRIFYKIFCVPLEKKALSEIPFIITVCPQLKDLIKKKTKSEIIVIPNGIDASIIKQIKSTKKIKNPSLVFIGFLTKRKGVQDLIYAMAEVKRKIPDVKLYILGKGPYLPKLKQLTKSLKLEDNIVFTGFVSEKEKFDYLKSADVFVLPTYWESFPIVLPEAMACGTPIICTDVAGNSFAVDEGKNGHLIQPGDVDALGKNIIDLLSDEEKRKKMTDWGLLKSKKFKWEKISENTKKLYDLMFNLKSKTN